MSGTRSGSSGPDGFENGSWASETLPLSVRKELLERELKKLGFRKDAGRTAGGGDTAGGQQEAATASHPQAEADTQHGG